MPETKINDAAAAQIIQSWQAEQRPVEVLIRFSQGMVQSHPGYITYEPEGRVVVADVVDKDHYLTTVLDLSAFETIKLSETESALIFEEPSATSRTFESVTIARRKQ
ncbi:MAG: hypothetical protein L0229_16235 [Blastocatellia bacterium]|nr:hypothetical protein [Blastocatellia bacterium]